MITAKTYQQRRKKLSKIVHGAPIVITAFSAVQQTNDGSAPFVQESSFFWLTGIAEPHWQLIIFGDKSWLISPAKTAIQRTFDGGMSADEAQKISGIKYVNYEDDYEGLLKKIALKHTAVYTVFKHPHSKYYDFALNPAYQKLHKQLRPIFSELRNCRQEVAKLKAIKTAEEIELIKQAIAISVEGFNNVQEKLATARFEYEIEATLSYAFRVAGSQGHAYEPIVAMGKNACTLHYIENNDALPSNGLVLIDAGAKVGGYAADITRTYAIGTPSEREKNVHAEVEQAHQAIIELIKAGVSLKDYQKQVETIMKQALKNLNLLNKPEDYDRYFPHAISHGLGIDVHDSLGGYDTFQPGMVLTVEPGIYIPEEKIGVRIEDDILVTSAGNVNLSAALPTSL
ncbi:MAG: pepP [Candidatus Saccharibacteria bacterium]|nr:pepP [Candidatus Saccharibacteria bacterium]